MMSNYPKPNVPKPTGIRNQMSSIMYHLRNDEELLRLLYYKKDPLDKSKPNIIGSDKYWDIVNKHIFFGEKDSEIVDEALTRIYVYTGRRREVFLNTAFAKQYFEVKLLAHEDLIGADYMRLEALSDRVNQLLLHNRVAGVSKITYHGGDPYQAPRQFQTYLHIYSMLVPNKVNCDG